jgi:hypothetical protein
MTSHHHKALSTEIIKLLVEQGACNVNACDGDGDTPLHLSFYIARRVPEFIAVSECVSFLYFLTSFRCTIYVIDGANC